MYFSRIELSEQSKFNENLKFIPVIESKKFWWNRFVVISAWEQLKLKNAIMTKNNPKFDSVINEEISSDLEDKYIGTEVE